MQELEFKNVLENMKHPFVVAAQSMWNFWRSVDANRQIDEISSTLSGKLVEVDSAGGREFEALIGQLDERYQMANEITEYLSTIVEYLNVSDFYNGGIDSRGSRQCRY